MRKLLLLLCLPVTAALAQPPAAISNWPITGTPSNTTFLRGDGTWAAVSAGSVTPPQVWDLNGGGGAVDALSLRNTTAATVSINQYSPDLRFQGSGWKTTATAGSMVTEWRIYNATFNSSTTPLSYLYFDSQTNGGVAPGVAWTNRMQVWDGMPGTNGSWLFVDNLKINGSAGKGVLELSTQSSGPSTSPSSNNNWLYSNSAGHFVWKDSAGTIHDPQDAANITSGTVATARLATTGTASGTTFLRGDQTWATPAAGGGIATDTFWAAKGDLAIATANDAASVLGVGTDGQVLTADSTQTTGVKWAAAGGTGTVKNTAGSLTSNAVVLGAGTVETKVVSPGITTDGSSVLSLGNNSTTAGLKLYTSGNVATTLVASGTVARTATLPNATTTLVGTDTTDTLTNKTLEGALIGDSTSPGFTMRNAGNALTTVNPSANVAAVTVTLPITTTTLVGKDTTDILTSKTLENAVLGDSTIQGFLMKNATNQTTTVLPTSSGTPTITLPSVTTTLVGQSDLGTNVATFLGTPSSANLRGALTDENGTGAALFNAATTPDFTTGITIGAAAASRKVLVGDGTKFAASTETYAVPGTSGNLLTSDGTNWTSAAPVVTASSTTTFTNKRVTPRVTTISSSFGTPTFNTDNCDAVTLTGVSATITNMSTNMTGTPNNFDKLIIRLKDDGTARGITWGNSFRSSQAILPTTTVSNKVTTVGFIWDSVRLNGASAAGVWSCVAVDQEP